MAADTRPSRKNLSQNEGQGTIMISNELVSVRKMLSKRITREFSDRNELKSEVEHQNSLSGFTIALFFLLGFNLAGILGYHSYCN